MAGSSGGCHPRPRQARPQWAVVGGAGGQLAAVPATVGVAGLAVAVAAAAAAEKEQADNQKLCVLLAAQGAV